jgi:hypothetical protein
VVALDEKNFELVNFTAKKKTGMIIEKKTKTKSRTNPPSLRSFAVCQSIRPSRTSIEGSQLAWPSTFHRETQPPPASKSRTPCAPPHGTCGVQPQAATRLGADVVGQLTGIAL